MSTTNKTYSPEPVEHPVADVPSPAPALRPRGLNQSILWILFVITGQGLNRNGLTWRKWFHTLHRELGYLFFGATIVYAVSGLYLNHRSSWSLAYDHVVRQKFEVAAPGRDKVYTSDEATTLLALAGVNGDYQGHDASRAGEVKILFQGGNATLNRDTGHLVVETHHPRPMPFVLTYIQLHCNPGAWWTWFGDSYCAALIIMAFSGIFLLKGKLGLFGRGGLLVLIGIAVPTALVWFHL